MRIPTYDDYMKAINKRELKKQKDQIRKRNESLRLICKGIKNGELKEIQCHYLTVESQQWISEQLAVAGWTVKFAHASYLGPCAYLTHDRN